MIDSLVNSIAGEVFTPDGITHPSMNIPHAQMVSNAYGYKTRTWIGLTLEEKQEWIDAMPRFPDPQHLMNLLNIMEARLKEANK
ncbi:hypothetical protein UFOVP173_47 [uncultured Caudovirales phage]|uniref:Uncharacterized protein n=1 Tax=uncultured Caudovirales phage TaxID=2100421 RepID=A0A6J7WCI8_9CAUD|nr:hypothetical protein UFOVP173_47 [uncultured Caudovirales phage]